MRGGAVVNAEPVQIRHTGFIKRKGGKTMQDVDCKHEALRMAVLVMTQSATAGKGDKIPTPDEVLLEAKKIYNWFKEKE